MYELNFSQETRSTTITLMIANQVILSGHVFLGDSSAEQYCTMLIHRPHLMEDGMREAMKQAFLGITGDSEQAEQASQAA